MLLMIVTIGVCAVAFKSEFWWLTLALIIPLMGIIFYALKRSFDFANSHPYAAIMEGAELLQHEKILHASKTDGLILPSPPITEVPAPKLLDKAQVDDSPPTSVDNKKTQIVDDVLPSDVDDATPNDTDDVPPSSDTDKAAVVLDVPPKAVGSVGDSQ